MARQFFKRGTDVFELGEQGERKLELPEFKSLGLNFDFLKEGQPISLNEGVTGNADQMINEELVKNNQDPFNLENQSTDQLSQILKTIQSQISQGNQNQTSALDILRQSRETAGIPGLTEKLAGVQSLIGQRETGFEQASNVLSEQLAPQPFITGQQAVLERRKQTELAGLQRQELALESRLGRAEEGAKFEAGLTQEERQFQTTQRQQQISNLFDLAKTSFGIQQDLRSQARADSELGLKYLELQRNQALDPLKRQQIEADIALTKANTIQTQAQTNKINKEIQDSLNTNIDLRTAITNLPVGQQDSAFGAIASFKNARDIIGLLDKGVETGPISGRLRKGISVFGIPLFPSGQALGLTGEDFNKFSAATTAFTANYIKALSGVQVSDREREFLMSALPSPNNQESVNRANVEMLLQFLRNKYELQLGLDFDQFAGEIPQVGSSAANQYINSLGL